MGFSFTLNGLVVFEIEFVWFLKFSSRFLFLFFRLVPPSIYDDQGEEEIPIVDVGQNPFVFKNGRFDWILWIFEYFLKFLNGT